MMVDNAELLRISSSEVAQRWMTNSKRYDALRKVKLILAEVHDRFENVRENGFPPNPETIVKPVRDYWEMSDEEANTPEFLYMLAHTLYRICEFDRCFGRGFPCYEILGIFGSGWMRDASGRHKYSNKLCVLLKLCGEKTASQRDAKRDLLCGQTPPNTFFTVKKSVGY